jgi:hypothetical protein
MKTKETNHEKVPGLLSAVILNEPEASEASVFQARRILRLAPLRLRMTDAGDLDNHQIRKKDRGCILPKKLCALCVLCGLLSS